MNCLVENGSAKPDPRLTSNWILVGLPASSGQKKEEEEIKRKGKKKKRNNCDQLGAVVECVFFVGFWAGLLRFYCTVITTGHRCPMGYASPIRR